MKKKRSMLSRLEWEIMNVVWEIGGSPCVRDVLETAYPDRNKAYTTVQTVMNNLEKKGFLRKKMIGLVNFYKPAKRRREALKKETSFFMENVFGGTPLEMANYLLSNTKLSHNEIKDLKDLINKKEQELKGDR